MRTSKELLSKRAQQRQVTPGRNEVGMSKKQKSLASGIGINEGEVIGHVVERQARTMPCHSLWGMVRNLVFILNVSRQRRWKVLSRGMSYSTLYFIK